MHAAAEMKSTRLTEFSSVLFGRKEPLSVHRQRLTISLARGSAIGMGSLAGKF